MMDCVKKWQLGMCFCLLAVIVSVGAVYGQDDVTVNAAVQSRTLAQDQVKYFIVVDGAAGSLPDQTVLKINLYYSFPLKKDDPAVNTPIKDRSRILDTKRCRTKEGKYVIDFGPYSKNAPPGDYYITVTCDSPKLAVDYILNLGGFQEANEYRDNVLDIIRQQAFQIEPLFREVKAFFLDNVAKPVSATSEADLKSAQQWLDRIVTATDEIAKTCSVYDEFRVMGVISTYKNTAVGAANLLKSLSQGLYDAYLTAPDKRNVAFLKEKVEAFRISMEEDLSSLGWIKQFNKGLLTQAIKDIRAFMDDKKATAIPASISQSLLALGEELPSSYYKTVSLLATNLSIWAKKPAERDDDFKKLILGSVETLECLLHDHKNGEHNHEKDQKNK
ncbi:MAG: hypothetical protein V1701_10555 [Planctomycetota bacterium]